MDNKGLMGEQRHIQATTTTNRCVPIWSVEYDGGIDMITLMFTSRVRAAMEQQGGVVVILEVIQEVKEWSTYMVSYYHTLLSRVHTCSSRSSSTSIWITCLPPGGLIIPCIISSHSFVQPITTPWSYTYNNLPGNAYANQNGVPSLATFNPYDMASYGGGKVIKYHHQPKNITLKIMLASSFCPRSDHQLRWHPDRHLTRNHIPCPQSRLVDGQQQKFNMHLWSCTSSKMSL